MARHEHDRVESIDRSWDQYLSGVQNAAGNEDELKQVARLHALDDAPPAPDALRERLDDELQSMFAAQATGENTREPSREQIGDDTPALLPVGGRREPEPLQGSGRFRKWGELAAMLLVLIIAIAATALYGDDAYDFAQRQLASGEDDAAMSELREQLMSDGSVAGLNFDEAAALTPFEVVQPDNIPEGLGEPEYIVTRQVGSDGAIDWNVWGNEALFTIDDFDLEPVSLRAQPSWEHSAIPLPRESEVEGENAPAGNLDIVTINGTHVVRIVDISEEREASTYYVWRQGHVDHSLKAPIAVDLTEEQVAWVDMPEAPFGSSDIEQMIGSLIERGPLDDDTEVMHHRGLTMDGIAEWLPTAPLPDDLPEQLELQRADAWHDGPNLFLRHTTNEHVEDIWVRSFPGMIALRGEREPAHDSATQTIDVAGESVERTILTDPAAPEVSEFLLAVDAHPDLLLPWLESDSGNALATYLWEIAGMSFIMGVEIRQDFVEQSVDGDAVLSEDVSAQDWLALIEQQRAFANERLDPEVLFPVLTREATDEDELPEHPDRPGQPAGPGENLERSRLIGETDETRYYISEQTTGAICISMAYLDEDGEVMPAASACNRLYSVAERGVGVHHAGMGQPTRIAYVLPHGYDEVVDENGELIAEVEDQLFAISFDSGDPRPSEMIARGQAGELTLGLGTSSAGRSEENP